MTPAQTWALGAAAALVIFSAVLSAAQTALARMTLLRALKLAEENGHARRAARLAALMETAPRTINSLALHVLGLQVTAVAIGAVVAAAHLDAPVAVAVAAVAGALVLFVVGEAAPKTFALQRTDKVALATAGLVTVVVRLGAPLAALLVRAGNIVAPGKGLPTGPFVTEDELREMIDVAEEDEVIEESERAMIHSIFELGDTVVREVMVPRPDMVLVSAGDPLADVVDLILSAGHSRVPVYDGDRDHIVGLIYAKDVLRRLHDGRGESGPWQDLLRPAHFVPELKPVDELLRELQASKVHMAVVVDEYGATAGLVTIEDLLEEIVGEIVDEYDREEALVEELGEAGWRVDARLPVDELSELVSSDLPHEEWDTVGGLLFGLLGHVPSPGERVEIDGIRLVAERVKGRRIAKVLVERRAEPDPQLAGQERP